MNTAVIVGRLTDAGPKLRYSESGKPELFLVVIHEEPGRDGTNYRTFIPVVIVGPRAEPLAESLVGGECVATTGKLTYRKVKRRDGEESKLMVVSFDAEVIARAPVGDEVVASEVATPEPMLVASGSPDVSDMRPKSRAPRRSNASTWGAGPVGA